MKEWETVRYIARRTRENSLMVPGKVVFGLWNRGTGAVCITDDIYEVEARVKKNHDVIRTYVDGWEVEQIGGIYGTCDGMVHMNRELLWRIRSM